ncbi:MAG TPA: sigma-54 dependent transcriptional regulator [Candidatus Tectomicrobia bacterium]|jgi:DNA-binding NtrC family response regulator|nr:sigma-54 dependent transcriptional regulator [Candidatus Tectomicrobia bacterium]
MQPEVSKPLVLAVDDELGVLESYKIILEDTCEVRTVADGTAALKVLAHEDIRLVILDLRLPDMEGLEVLLRIKEMDEYLGVIVVTAVGDVKTAVRAMQAGASEYLVKPFDIETLQAVVARTLERQALMKEVLYLRSEVEGYHPFVDIVGRDEKMLEIFELIERVSDSDATVLITGESGTGKELIARALHQRSHRSLRPFVAINCTAIPENLIESELFGHERGAFTGAVQRRIGKFELAHSGTLFLDEIGSMRLDMQTKLLRALQEREIERVGGERTIKVDVRVVAATNADLRELVKAKAFRDDLYYRLNVIPVYVPPLRARKGDIALLIQYFLEKYNRRFNRRVRGFSLAAIEAMQAYDWPGNVRELENIVERLVVISKHESIQLRELPLDLQSSHTPLVEQLEEEGYDLRKAVHQFEREYIRRVLEKTRWNQTVAARMLGIHRNTLLGKIEQLDLR